MKQVNPGIFKAYDIRGVFPEELNEDVAYRIANAYAQYLKPRRIVVGSDMRTSSPGIRKAVVEGLADAGVDVTDIGLITTDMVYFAVGKFSYDGGIMVTASHNPKQWNGMKMVREGAIALSGDAGIPEIKKTVLAGTLFKAPARGKVESRDLLGEFVAHVLTFVDPAAIAPMKIVVDTANGMGGLIVPAVFNKLKCRIVPMYFDIDGTFPNHEANPLLEENVVDLINRVKQEKADLGLAFDGDADRCFFIDDTGEFVPGDFVTALLSQAVVEKNPGAHVLYDVRASRAVPDLVAAAGGTAHMNRVGHAFFKQRMKTEGGLFGGEVSGHYYFRQNYNADSGIIPALVMLELLSKKGKKLSEILSALKKKYFITGEINSKVADAPAKLKELEKRFGDGKVYHMDGLSVEYPDWHFNVRMSNTEPLLRLNLEAVTREKMESKRDEILAIIRS